MELIKAKTKKQRGSLALEQILFIGATVAMSAGIYAFYGDLSSYFRDFDVAAATQNAGENTDPAK